ncbi:MAG: hypothetical protein WDN44_10765 [Sphingomonas sp.]
MAEPRHELAAEAVLGLERAGADMLVAQRFRLLERRAKRMEQHRIGKGPGERGQPEDIVVVLREITLRP